MNPFNTDEPKVDTKNPFNVDDGTVRPVKIPTTLSKGEFLPYLEGGAANTPLGIYYNTVAGIPKATVEVAKDIGQSIARTVGSVGITAANVASQAVGAKPQFQEEIQTKGSPIAEASFGKDETISTLPRRVEKTREFLKPYIGETAGGISAVPLVFGGTLLDLWGGGKSKLAKEFLEFAVKEDNPKRIYEALVKKGVKEIDARILGAQLAPTKTIDEAKNVLASHEKTMMLPKTRVEAPAPEAPIVPRTVVDDIPTRPVSSELLPERVRLSPAKQKSLIETTRQELSSLSSRYPQLQADINRVNSALYEAEKFPTQATDILKNVLDDVVYLKKGEAIPRAPMPEKPDFLTTSRSQATPVAPSGVKTTAPVAQTPPAQAQQAAGLPQRTDTLPRVPEEDLWQSQSYTDSIQQEILNARDAKALLDEFEMSEKPPVDYPEQVLSVRSMADRIGLREKAKDLKDISGIEKNWKDMWRNTYNVFGADYPIVKKSTLDPLADSKGAFVKMLEDKSNEMYDYVRMNLGIKMDSKEDFAIKNFGEGKRDYDSLVKEFGKEKADNIVKADTYFRTKYDQLIDEVNVALAKIYPNDPSKLVPKLENYYRHGAEASDNYLGFQRVMNILENPIRLDPNLVGRTEDTRPKIKWASFMQRRIADRENKQSAIAGYLEYLNQSGYAIHIDKNIGAFRELTEILRRSTPNKNLNNYIYSLEKFTQGLAGKSHDLDRSIADQIPGGRTTMAAIDWAHNRAKSNKMLLNPTVSLSQIYGVPNVIGDVGVPNAIKALKRTIAYTGRRDPLNEKSMFKKERFLQPFQQFDESILSNPKKFATWMITALDKVSTDYALQASRVKFLDYYQKKYGPINVNNLPPKIEQAMIRYADDNARRVIGGRGIGEKPLIYNSKAFDWVMPFQLDVGNLWWVLQDIAKRDKRLVPKIGDFLGMFVALYMINNTLEEFTGRRIALDPIDALGDAATPLFKGEPLLAGGRLAGEVLSNIPVGQVAAFAYPEYGLQNIAGQDDWDLPTRRQLFGAESDPTRFGGGPLAVQGLQKPISSFLLPFGGGAIERAIKGIGSVNEGVSMTQGEVPKFQYEIDQTLENYIRSALFGKYGTTNAKEYYDQKNNPQDTTGGNPFNI